MALKHVLLGTAALAVASVGAAQAGTVMPDGWYVSLAAGANWVPNDKVRWSSTGTSTNYRYSWDTGYAVLASVGYDFDNHWRAELEVGYRHNKSKSACTAGGCFDPDNTGVGSGPPGESLWQLSQMVNVLYDFSLGGNWTASVGAGIGGNLVVFEDEGHEFDDYVLAGQLIGEVGYRFADRWQAFATYHYMLMSDPNLSGGGSYTPVHMDLQNHTVAIGIRFDLQADHMAPPPEPERPMPAEPKRPRQYIVFFGFNKSNLSAEAERVVSEAAAAAKQFGSAEITVVGHTDTVGSNSYNMRLSLRRSGAVKAELVQDGIKGDMIQASGKGETELMVETGDGVKEPQNRRATINLH